jgi:hypothetical protein
LARVVRGASALHDHVEPYQVAGTGTLHFGGSGIAASGATAVMGIDSTSLPPSIERDPGYHEHRSDTLPPLTHGHAKSSVPAFAFVTAKQLTSVQQATPAIPDLVATLTIVVVVCIASGVWIARYLGRLIVARAAEA